MARLSKPKARRLAEIYIFEQPYNKTKAYRQLQEEFNGEVSEYANLRNYASKAFRDERVIEAVAELQEEAQKTYDIKKEAIVAQLQEIALDDETTKRDKLTALKQLTDIAGLATQKVDVNAKADIEVVIE